MDTHERDAMGRDIYELEAVDLFTAPTVFY